MLVYRLISPSGKCYIGLTSRSFAKRLKEHILSWKSANKSNCKKLYNAFNKYHPDLWSYEILFKTEIQEDAELKEIEYIKQFNSVNNGYNILIGGGLSRLGVKHSEETRKRMHLAGLGRVVSEQTREKLRNNRGFKGKKHSEAVKQRLKEVNLGKKRGPLSEETKLKISLKNKGRKRSQESINKHRQAMLGYKHSEETKRKMSMIMSGRVRPPFSDEWKNNLSKAHMGQKRLFTEEHRKNLSKSKTGKKFTEEHRKNISKGHLGQIAWNKGKKLNKEMGCI